MRPSYRETLPRISSIFSTSAICSASTNPFPRLASYPLSFDYSWCSVNIMLPRIVLNFGQADIGLVWLGLALLPLAFFIWLEKFLSRVQSISKHILHLYQGVITWIFYTELTKDCSSEAFWTCSSILFFALWEECSCYCYFSFSG